MVKVPPELLVIDANGTLVPIGPLKIVAPTVLTIKACPPLVVPLTVAILIVLPELLVIVLDTISVVILPAADRSTAPTVDTLPPNIVLPVPLIVTLLSCVVAPKVPVLIVPPLLVSVRAR